MRQRAPVIRGLGLVSSRTSTTIAHRTHAPYVGPLGGW